MLVRVRSGTVLGVSAVPIEVEVEAGDGMPGFFIVGQASTAVQESKVRVLAAIRNAGLKIASRRVTVNLAPADLRKEGTGFDLDHTGSAGLAGLMKAIALDNRLSTERVAVIFSGVKRG